MCGFVGVVDPDRTYSNDTFLSLADQMGAEIAHRGPDDKGTWFDFTNDIAISFRRLSIIELSTAAHQPLYADDSPFTMVFNGEIYNYLEIYQTLRDEGCNFIGNSDSVVLFHAFTHWGIEKTLSKINGMFAIALWHKRNKTLYLIRDRLGQKPLYYYKKNKTVIFGSELKSFLKYPSFEKRLNQEGVHEFLKFGYVPEPLSIYENTYKVKPGQFLAYHVKTNELKSLPYWSLEEVVTQETRVHANEEQVHETLKDAVRLRMRSDVPFGSFLSGGIDSSLVTALMQSQSDKPIKTFSIGFNESQYDESKYAKEIAGYLQTDHTGLYVTPDETREVIPKIPEIYDEPFADSSQIPTYLLSKMTKSYVTVALSGDGGDEAFGGYNRHFWVPKLWGSVLSKPKLLKYLLARLIMTLSAHHWNSLTGRVSRYVPKRYGQKNIGDKLYKLLPLLAFTDPMQIYERLTVYWEDPQKIMAYQPTACRTLNNISQDIISEMIFRDSKYYLPGDILTKVDRASMAVSLEVRSPFLDYRLIEQAWQLPMHLKVAKGEGKIVLKNILKQYVPASFFERPKMGFGVPIAEWLRGPLKKWSYELLNDSTINGDDLLDVSVLNQYWKEHNSGERNWQYQLWTVLMFQAWRNQYNV